MIVGFAETFKALSDPVRREILVLLKDGKLSAGEIAGCFEMTQATVSYHLSKLKQADLILSVFEEVMLWLSQFGGFKDET